MIAEQLKASLITYAMKGGLSASWRKEHNYSFELWRNLPLSKICHAMTYGTARKSSSEGDVVVIRMGNLQGGEIIWSKLAYTTDRDDIEKYLLTPGDILFNRTNSPELVGKTSIYRGERPAIYAGYLIKLDYDKNIIIGEYLNYVMNSQEERRFCADVRVNGVCQANINAKKIGAFSIPVPPIDEQQYIVSCLNELLHIVEEYGKSQSALHVLETELPEKLRVSLLQQAIMGKLVPQLDDEPAVDIDAEEPEEVPFTIPEKWRWVRLGDVVSYGKTEQTAGNLIPKGAWILELEDVQKDSGIIIQKKRNIATKSNKNKFYKGNVLYSKLRPYLNKVLIADENGYCTTEIVPIDTASYGYEIIAEYLKIYLMSPYFVQYAEKKSYGVKMPRLGTRDVKSAVFPLPPLAEQRRIVARINEIFPFLDSMVEY